jgi:hypothetical protein
MGGEVTVTNGGGGGAEFTLTVPAGDGEPD